MLDKYYSGPPKFEEESVSQRESLAFKNRIKALNDELTQAKQQTSLIKPS